MKKNKPILDERILYSKEKINSEAFLIVITLLILSIIVKALILDMSFKSYMFEFGICIISLIYVSVRNIAAGNIFYNPTVENELIISLIVGVAASAVISMLNYIRYGGIAKLYLICFVITFLSFFGGTFFLLFISDRLSKANADKTFKKYND